MPKILYIGFGIEPFAKGGALVYQDSLMEGIKNRGWDVTFFLSAPRYTISNKPFLKTWHKNGIKFIELYNPLCTPGYQNDPKIQCNSPVIESMTRKILAEEKPNIVHIHELQLHPVSIINIIKEMGIPAVHTIHNYYDICPQRDLFYKGRELCPYFPSVDYCADCMAVKPRVVKLDFLLQEIKKNLKPFIPLFLLNKYCATKKADKDIKSVYKTEQYRNRLAFFVERLNKLNIIHCSSNRAGQIFIKAGVLKDKIKIISLSTKNITNISPKTLRDNHYPIVFNYIGGTALHKGFNVLIEAFSRLNQSRAKLIMWKVRPEDLPKNLNLNIETRGSYALSEINDVFKEIDIGIVPSVWEESFGLIGIELLCAKIPV
ncbi:MAG: glycosyltransferase, partial [Candidatus Parcubacteria bacterium]|nr:glycosyltransferase [Candidatus Parcubacteria bacterium]